MLRRVLSRLTTQRNMPPHIGALINIYTSTAILYSPLTLMGVATTVYGLWGADAMREWFPWFTVWHLLGAMILFILVMMVIFHKFVLPSIFAFQVQQQYKHRNPLAKDAQAILKRQGNIEKRMESLESAVSDIRNALVRGGKQ